ncbi:hypothetical protein ACOSP7_006232 [Xanthoceras sorbifolium]
MNVEEGGKSRKVMVSFNRRKTTLKKNTSQLSKLCDVNVAMVCFGLDWTVETWPENKPEVHGIIDRYKCHSEKEREKYNLSGFLGTKKMKLEDKKSNKKNKNDVDQEKKKNHGGVHWTWDPRLDQLSEEELGIASGIGADSALAASCHTRVIQYVVPHVPQLLCSFPTLIVKHHEQQDVEKEFRFMLWLSRTRLPCFSPRGRNFN